MRAETKPEATTDSTPSVNYLELAKKVTEVDSKIVGAMLVRKGALVAAFNKPGVPAPQKAKLGELILQAELVVSISKRNADLFGQVRVATVQHSLLTIFIFPLGHEITLAFALDGPPTGYEKLTSAVSVLLHSTDPTLYP